jgi:hypothetical protein
VHALLRARVADVEDAVVQLQFAVAGDGIHAIVARLVLAMGVRLAVPVDRLDELSIAVDVLLDAAEPPATVRLRPLPGGLEVVVDPVNGDRLSRDVGTVRGLADRFSSDERAVTVAIGA